MGLEANITQPAFFDATNIANHLAIWIFSLALFIFILSFFVAFLGSNDFDFSRINPIARIEKSIAARKAIKNTLVPKSTMMDRVKFKAVIIVSIVAVLIVSSGLSAIPRSLAMKESAKEVCNSSDYVVIKKASFPFEKGNIFAYLRPLGRDFYEIIACKSDLKEINIIYSSNREVSVYR